MDLNFLEGRGRVSWWLPIFPSSVPPELCIENNIYVIEGLRLRAEKGHWDAAIDFPTTEKLTINVGVW